MVSGLPRDIFFFFAGNLYSLPRVEGETVGCFQRRALDLFGERQEGFHISTSFDGLSLDLSDSLEWVAIRENDRPPHSRCMGMREQPFYIGRSAGKHPDNQYRSLDDWVRQFFGRIFATR
jgi:hypothetical protein